MAGELALPFECPRCGLAAVVVVDAADRMGDEERALEVAACPACARRRSVPWGRSVLRVLGGAAAAFVGGAAAILGSAAYFGIWLPVAAIAVGAVAAAGTIVVGVLGGTVFEIRRWRAGGRVRIVRQLREPRRLALPAAIARRT